MLFPQMGHRGNGTRFVTLHFCQSGTGIPGMSDGWNYLIGDFCSLLEIAGHYTSCLVRGGSFCFCRSSPPLLPDESGGGSLCPQRLCCLPPELSSAKSSTVKALDVRDAA